MPYVREHLLAQWNSNAVKRAFKMRFDGAQLGTMFPKQVSRSLSGDLLEATGTSKKQIVGILLIDEADDSTTVDYDAVTYELGQLDDLEAMFAATDLQVKRYGDAAFFDAATMGDAMNAPFTTVGTVLTVPIRIVER